MNIHQHSWINMFMNTKFMNSILIHQNFMNSSWRALWTVHENLFMNSLQNFWWTEHEPFMHFHERSCIFMNRSSIFMNRSCIFMNRSCIFMNRSCIFMNVHAFSWTFMNRPWKFITSWTNFRRGMHHLVISTKCQWIPSQFAHFENFRYNLGNITNEEKSYNKRYLPLSFSKYNKTSPKLLYS